MISVFSMIWCIKLESKLSSAPLYHRGGRSLLVHNRFKPSRVAATTCPALSPMSFIEPTMPLCVWNSESTEAKRIRSRLCRASRTKEMVSALAKALRSRSASDSFNDQAISWTLSLKELLPPHLRRDLPSPISLNKLSNSPREGHPGMLSSLFMSKNESTACWWDLDWLWRFTDQFTLLALADKGTLPLAHKDVSLALEQARHCKCTSFSSSAVNAISQLVFNWCAWDASSWLFSIFMPSSIVASSRSWVLWPFHHCTRLMPCSFLALFFACLSCQNLKCLKTTERQYNWSKWIK